MLKNQKPECLFLLRTSSFVVLKIFICPSHHVIPLIQPYSIHDCDMCMRNYASVFFRHFSDFCKRLFVFCSWRPPSPSWALESLLRSCAYLWTEPASRWAWWDICSFFYVCMHSFLFLCMHSSQLIQTGPVARSEQQVGVASAVELRPAFTPIERWV